MKNFDVAQKTTLLANIGVIAGIVFLGIEMNQNNKFLRADAISAVLETRLVRQSRVLDGIDFASLMERNATQDELSPEDTRRLEAASNEAYLGWQRDYLFYKEGILPEEYFRINFSVMRNAIFGEGGAFSRREHWESWSDRNAPSDFKRFVEECIASDCESIP